MNTRTTSSWWTFGEHKTPFGCASTTSVHNYTNFYCSWDFCFASTSGHLASTGSERRRRQFLVSAQWYSVDESTPNMLFSDPVRFMWCIRESLVKMTKKLSWDLTHLLHPSSHIATDVIFVIGDDRIPAHKVTKAWCRFYQAALKFKMKSHLQGFQASL